MPKLTKKQRADLQQAIGALDYESPRFHASEHVTTLLKDPDLDLYLRTWVLPYLRDVAEESK